MDRSGLPDMFTRYPQACGPWASGGHIGQATSIHVTSIMQTYPSYNLLGRPTHVTTIK